MAQIKIVFKMEKIWKIIGVWYLHKVKYFWWSNCLASTASLFLTHAAESISTMKNVIWFLSDNDMEIKQIKKTITVHLIYPP